ncbi:MAG: PQQ-binding-like beta-propeller repeat protein [Planctomycetota bacterium]
MIDHTMPSVRRAPAGTQLAHLAVSAACAAALFASAAMAQSTKPAAPAAAPVTATPKSGADTRKEAMASLEARYVCGPAAADEFGYRIVWQTESLATKGAVLQIANAPPDSVWFGDSSGSIVRLRRDSGETVWRSSTFQGIERMLALEYLPAEHNDNVYVVTELGSVIMDAATGNLLKRTRFSQLPSNVPAIYGQTMIFGTGTGLASWFQYSTGYNWRATTLGGHVIAPVTVTGDIAIVGSTNGTVLAMDAPSAGIRWSRKLSAGVETQIAADAQACYVAGNDQSLWAFDQMRGRVLWQYFTQTALKNPPTRLADGLYLQIPGEGLVSFTPLPNNKPDGEVLWKSKAPGNIIGRMNTNVMAWDRATRTLSAVDVGNGRIVHQVSLPKVESIEFFPMIDGEIFIASSDGTVERLEPLSRKPSSNGAATNAEPTAGRTTTTVAPVVGGAAAKHPG